MPLTVFSQILKWAFIIITVKKKKNLSSTKVLFYVPFRKCFGFLDQMMIFQWNKRNKWFLSFVSVTLHTFFLVMAIVADVRTSVLLVRTQAQGHHALLCWTWAVLTFSILCTSFYALLVFKGYTYGITFPRVFHQQDSGFILGLPDEMYLHKIWKVKEKQETTSGLNRSNFLSLWKWPVCLRASSGLSRPLLLQPSQQSRKHLRLCVITTFWLKSWVISVFFP